MATDLDYDFLDVRDKFGGPSADVAAVVFEALKGYAADVRAGRVPGERGEPLNLGDVTGAMFHVAAAMLVMIYKRPGAPSGCGAEVIERDIAEIRIAAMKAVKLVMRSLIRKRPHLYDRGY